MSNKPKARPSTPGPGELPGGGLPGSQSGSGSSNGTPGQPWAGWGDASSAPIVNYGTPRDAAAAKSPLESPKGNKKIVISDHILMVGEGGMAPKTVSFDELRGEATPGGEDPMDIASASVLPSSMPSTSTWMPGGLGLQSIPCPGAPPPPAIAANRPQSWLQALQTASWLRAYLKSAFVNREFVHQPDIIPVLARAIKELCGAAVLLLSEDPILLKLTSPCYVLGDIHGNYGDLEYFLNHILAFYEPAYTPAKFLFLGDYVDRGPWSVEVAALLLAFKVLSPKAFFLLRGNHEVRAVNGAISLYGNGSFRYQSEQLFGANGGEEVWHAINNAFLQMPLAAIIDETIFCVHGGIPRFNGGQDKRLSLLTDPRFPRFNTTALDKGDTDSVIGEQRQIMTDLLWADPAEANMDPVGLDSQGFGPSDRSPNLRAFGNVALDAFFANHGLQLMIRAHQHKWKGVRRAKGGRVLTIFSSSNYCGTGTPAAAAFIANGILRLVIKESTESPSSVISEAPEEQPQRRQGSGGSQQQIGYH